MSTIDIKSLLGIDADTIEALMNRAAALYSEGKFEAMRKNAEWCHRLITR